MNGEINVDSLQYIAPEQNFFMDNLRIAATQSDERQKRLTISSNFLRGTIEARLFLSDITRQRAQHHAALHPGSDTARQETAENRKQFPFRPPYLRYGDTLHRIPDTAESIYPLYSEGLFQRQSATVARRGVLSTAELRRKVL